MTAAELQIILDAFRLLIGQGLSFFVGALMAWAFVTSSTRFI